MILRVFLNQFLWSGIKIIEIVLYFSFCSKSVHDIWCVSLLFASFYIILWQNGTIKCCLILQKLLWTWNYIRWSHSSFFKFSLCVKSSLSTIRFFWWRLTNSASCIFTSYDWKETFFSRSGTNVIITHGFSLISQLFLVLHLDHIAFFLW